MFQRFLLFSFIMLLAIVIQGQDSSVTKFIQCVEQQNGTDNLLMNGRPYVPAHTKAKGHPYFHMEAYKAGVVYINGNPYPVKRLKYNLNIGQLVLKHQRPNGTSQKVVLSDQLVDSFYIAEDLFVNRKLILAEQKQGGFLETIFRDRLAFYRMQNKMFNGSYSREAPNGQFIEQKPIYYLIKDGQQYQFTKKKEFLACFPEHKGLIKKYMKEQSLNWKKITKTQLYQLLRFCNGQI